MTNEVHLFFHQSHYKAVHLVISQLLFKYLPWSEGAAPLDRSSDVLPCRTEEKVEYSNYM